VYMDRRGFLETLTQLFSLCISVLLGLPVVRFLRESLSNEQREIMFSLTDISELTQDVQQVSFVRVVREGWFTRTDGDYVWVRKNEDGTFVAFEPHCTHLGCAYAWVEQKRQFHCPCHGGKFDENGKRIAGPPPRNLDRYEIKIEGNVLKIGKLLRD
jgi:menaquinol-cytochrome c reductase iron-sulfur subunit